MRARGCPNAIRGRPPWPDRAGFPFVLVSARRLAGDSGARAAGQALVRTAIGPGWHMRTRSGVSRPGRRRLASQSKSVDPFASYIDFTINVDNIREPGES